MRLYNSFTRSIEPFNSLRENRVKMYVCGVTPYDTTHVGHAFTYVFFDTLRRFLEYKGYPVEYTQNVTDVDDDLLKRAKETRTDWQELGEIWTKRYLSDMESLNVKMPTHFIKATEAIDEIIALVKALLEKDHAYVVDGTVFFHVPTFPGYGELSHYTTSEMISLSRERGADPDDRRKKNPLDFILWQRSLSGEPKWESPWSQGRPGWHIECSSMIKKTLGSQIDIHGGGFDLIYPHHESERAQSESATGNKPFVKYWTHTAMVKYENEKMSKSLGNLVHVSDLLKKYSADSIRYVLLSHHYRTPWEFQFGELDEAEKEIDVFKKVYKTLSKEKEVVNANTLEGISLLDDDMQTPEALMRLCELAKGINNGKRLGDSSDTREFRDLLQVLGFSFAGNPFN